MTLPELPDVPIDGLIYQPPDLPPVREPLLRRRPGLGARLAFAIRYIGGPTMDAALREADLALSPWQELTARLGIESPPPERLELLRRLDHLVDDQARRYSATTSEPMSHDERYRGGLVSALRVASELLGIDRHAASVSPSVLSDQLLPAVARVQWYRRAILWRAPLPEALRAELTR
jgi:hypothetical protein